MASRILLPSVAAASPALLVTSHSTLTNRCRVAPAQATASLTASHPPSVNSVFQKLRPRDSYSRRAQSHIANAVTLRPVVDEAGRRDASSDSKTAVKELEETVDTVVLLDVQEMMCAGCSSAVKEVLLSHPAVREATVNLVTESAAVTVSLPASSSVDSSVTSQVLPSGAGSREDKTWRSWLTNAGGDSGAPRKDGEAVEPLSAIERVRRELAETVTDAGFPCAARKAEEADSEGRRTHR